ncbi:Cyclic nucleotide-binding protein [Pseudocohnilembus persalinus]|uniref:Cyclic nucleotide-binding protein n=1 Tax=Pseudocohnilembus persalinus TaxID=266149 RepID=A0A0V0QU90_PSEPJ|nr:Cyclic nucleotide-binding protein [Pseudocohnilembus persalinus]|eukprot:KRX05855.1 Cyclic nucleotide-binding protein [Pseudocohnilembus persalinus]
MTHKKFYTGDIILKEGQESNNKLYILLKGKIGIVIKNYNNVYAKIEEEKQAKREVEIQKSMQENYKKYQKFTTEDARRINQKIIKELQRISIQKKNLKKIVKHNLYKYSLASTNYFNYKSDKNIINNIQSNGISESSQDLSSNSDSSDESEEYEENGDKVFGLTSNNLEKNPSILEYKNRQRNSLQQNSFGNTFIHSYKKNGSTTIQQQKIRQSRSSLFLPTPKDQPVLSKRLSQLLKLKEQQFKYKNQQNELQIVKKQKAIKNFQRIVNKIRSNTKVVNSFIQLRQRRIKQVQEIEEIVSSYGTIVNTLQEGQIVGEKALTADNPKDAKRNATVICLEDTDCIIMQRKDFLKIKNAYDKESITKTKLIQQLIPPFENINNKRIKYDIINYFKPCQVGKGQKLYEEDQKGDKIYLVKDGKLEITKKSLNQENLFYDENRQIKISLIDEPQIIGEELIQQEGIEGNYKYTVNALEFTNLYYLVKSDLLYRFPQDFQTYIKQACDNREQLRKIIYDKNNRQAEQKTGKLFEIDSNLKMLYYIDNHEIFSNMNEKNVEKQYKHAYHQLDNKVQKKKKNLMNQSNISQQNEKSCNNQLENIQKPQQYIPDNIDPQLYQDYVKFVYQENQKQQEIEEKYEENHEWKNQKIKSNFFANTGPSIEKYAKINFSKNQQPQIKIEIIDNKIVSNQQEKVYDFGQMKAFNKGQQQHLIAKGAIKGKKDLDYTQVKQNLKNQPLDQIKYNISAKKQKIFKKTIDMLESQQKMYSFVKPVLMENQSASTSTISDNLKEIKRNIFTQKNKSLSGQNFFKQDVKEQKNQTHLLYSKYQENSLLNKIPLCHKSQNLSSNSQLSTNHNFSSVQKTFSQNQQINQQLLKQRQQAKSQSNIFQSVSKDSEKEIENFVNNLNSKNQLAIQKSQKSSNNSLQYSYNKKQNQQQFCNKQIKFSNNNQQINEIENDKSIINLSEIQNQSKSYIQIDEINEQESINDKKSQMSQECDDNQKNKSKLQNNDVLNQLSNNTNQQLQQNSSSQRMKKIFKYIPKSAKNQRQLNASNCNQSQKICNSSQMNNNLEKQKKKLLNQSDFNLNQRKNQQKNFQAYNTKFMQYNIAFSQQEQDQTLKINKDQSVQGEISQQNSESYNENNTQDFPENTYFLNETNSQINQQDSQQNTFQRLTSKLGSNSSKHAEKFVQRFIAPQQSPEEVVEFCKVFDNNDSFIQK